MKQIVLLFFIAICTSCSSNSWRAPNEHMEITPTGWIYSFGPGKMEYKAQIDPDGDIAVLLNPLLDNTQIQFINIFVDKTAPTSLVGYCRIIVKEETDMFASLRHVQDLFFPIDPAPVIKFSLTGETIFISNKIVVLTDKKDQFIDDLYSPAP